MFDLWRDCAVVVFDLCCRDRRRGFTKQSLEQMVMYLIRVYLQNTCDCFPVRCKDTRPDVLIDLLGMNQIRGFSNLKRCVRTRERIHLRRHRQHALANSRGGHGMTHLSTYAGTSISRRVVQEEIEETDIGPINYDWLCTSTYHRPEKQ